MISQKINEISDNSLLTILILVLIGNTSKLSQDVCTAIRALLDNFAVLIGNYKFKP